MSPGVREWLAERSAANRCTVSRVPLPELRGWEIEPGTGNLVHETGKFFTVEGLDVHASTQPVTRWQQPIIHQPEIGILGVLVARWQGRLHVLMQAKMEPGNSNGVQLSPTVQATRSNFTRVHRGGGTPLLRHFLQPPPGSVLVDVLQSEQGAWFLGKRNRNIAVLVGDELPPEPSEDFRWVPLAEVAALLRSDNLVNMDARSVLSCLTSVLPAGYPTANDDPYAAALRRGFTPGQPARHPFTEVLSWFTEQKCRHEVTTRRLPLASLAQWHYSTDEVTHAHGRHFRMIGVEVRSSNREVRGWCQPMLAPRGRGVAAFVTRTHRGITHVLARAAVEPGLRDTVEIGPTVQCRPESYAHLPADQRPAYLDTVLSAPPERIRYDSILSEEGGRFYHAENRYLIVEAEPGSPAEAPEGFCWLTPLQLTRLVRHSHYLNVEARTLVAGLYSLSSGAEPV